VREERRDASPRVHHWTSREPISQVSASIVGARPVSLAVRTTRPHLAVARGLAATDAASNSPTIVSEAPRLTRVPDPESQTSDSARGTVVRSSCATFSPCTFHARDGGWLPGARREPG
jgi:hypothetical protein